METNKLTQKINFNLYCFAIENHQGVQGPEMIDPIEVLEEDVEASSGCCEIRHAENAILHAWLNRGNHTGLSNNWIDSASGVSADADIFGKCEDCEN